MSSTPIEAKPPANTSTWRSGALATRRSVRLWSSTSGRLMRVLRGPRVAISGLAYSPAGDLLATAWEDGTLRLTDAIAAEVSTSHGKGAEVPGLSNRATNQNSEPRPGSLFMPMWPCIIFTSRREIASPRPEPPKRRVVELSAWVNASKSRACASCGIPMPVSRTLTCSMA